MPATAYVRETLSGWGRFPVEPAHVYRPEKRAELRELLASGAEPSYIARGLGRSYGDAALNAGGGVVRQTRLNRFLSFDPQTGILECEAGVSFAEIIRHFLPRGFFPPVTPGTQFVTVGGAIAADVHGKNHHRDGTLANFVTDLQLLTADGRVMHCSPSENADVFWATAGGMGLTGIILTARLRLRRVESAFLTVDYRRARCLDEALDVMAETDAGHQYSVAWVDCLATGASFGRSVVMQGDHAPAARLGKDPWKVRERRPVTLPLHLLAFALNKLSVAAFNALYCASHRHRAGQLVDYQRFFYPLDAIRNWNRLYGRRGFVQYQVVFPPETARSSLSLLLRRLAQAGYAPYLAVLKRFGDRNQGLLSFPLKGITLALDIPVSCGLVEVLSGCDSIVLDGGGRLYLAKDALMSGRTFSASYPRLEEFRQLKARLDPAGMLSSSLARRLGITGPGVASG
jgi:decaprenylphospho-beta-D-ribofuranose 2-oxidase